MSTFLFSFDATITANGATPPTLEVLVGGVVVSSLVLDPTETSFDLFVEFAGTAPSSLTIRFDASSGSPTDSINISNAFINNNNVTTDLTATMLAQGQSSNVNADSAVFGRETPTLATPDVTGTGGDDIAVNGTNSADSIDALAGNDRVRGFGGDDDISGGAGNDFIFGEAGADTILGGAGDDIIFGNEGDDVILGEADNDILIGGAGADVLNGGAGIDSLIGDDGNDILFGEGDSDFLVGGLGDDILFGDDGDDFVIGEEGADALSGGAGDDQLIGGTGDDLLGGGDGNDELIGEDGDDVFSGNDGNDTIYGGDGNDEALGGADNDVIYGGDGNDELQGETGDDVVVGGAGADTISGGSGADVLHGHGLDAETISDILFNNPNVSYSAETGSFYQFVSGPVSWSAAQTAASSTTLNGVNGHLVTITSLVENDFVYQLGVDNGADNSIGASGNRIWLSATDIDMDQDWVWTSGLEAGVQFSTGSTAEYNFYENWGGGQPNNSGGSQTRATIWFNGGADDNTWDDRNDSDNHDYVIEWEGGLFSDDNAIDTIDGGAGNDWVYGYGGNDVLSGGSGIDVLFGGAGADTIDGEGDSDTIIGGTGADIIDAGDANDLILLHNGDFVAGESITGGAGTDEIVLTDTVTVDFSVGTIATVENLIGSNGNDDVTYTVQQALNFTSIDLGAGADNSRVNITGTVDVSGLSTPTVSNTENGFLTASAGADDLTIAGAQLDALIFGSGIIDFGGNTDILNITSTSADLNNLGATNASIVNLEQISAAGAGAAVTIDLSGQAEAFDITGSVNADTLTGGSGDDIFNAGAGNDILDGGSGIDTFNGQDGDDTIFGQIGSDVINGGNNNDILYALNASVNTDAVGATLVPGSISTVTDYSVDFAVDASGYTYAELEAANATNTGSHITSDGSLANGALEVNIEHSNGTSELGLAYFFDTITFTQDLTNAELSFDYRHIHANQNDNGEDSSIFFDLNGGAIDFFINTALGSGGATDTGWVTHTHSLGDVSAGDTITLFLGLQHTGATRNNEDATARFDDIIITGDVIASSSQSAGFATLDADSASANLLNGGAGADTLYGSSGNDTLNGDGGADDIFSGTVDTQTALLNSILTANPNVSYSFDTGNFYQVVTATLSNTAATTAANALTLNGVAGHLATITSATEQTFLEGLAGGVNTWLGGRDTGTEGVWTWVAGGVENGTQFANSTGGAVNGWYNNWTGGQPNDGDGTQDYLYLLNGTQWADLVNEGDGSTGFVTVSQYAVEWEGSAVFAALNNNTLNGGDGADTLYGSDGIDIFLFDNTNNVDTVENFNTLGRDKIDIGDILSYDPLTDDIADFVQLSESGGNTTISVDTDGTGGFTDIAQLNSVTGLDLDVLITGDNLIVI